MTNSSVETNNQVNFSAPRGFATTFKSDCKETFFPDDPFDNFKDGKPLVRAKKTLQYFVPCFEWLPKYNFKLFRYDLLAGITITSLAIPQGISYAKLGNVPPIVGLYSSFVPPFIYAIFGSSKHLAVGTVAACSLLIYETIGAKVDPKDDPTLYLHLWRWQSALAGVIFLIFLQITRYVRQKKPKLFWVSAMAPMVVVIVGCVFAYFVHGDKHGIQIVGPLKKGLNPPSVHLLNFDRRYLGAVVQAGPFSKTAVNYNSGCRTQMSNVVMGFCMMLVLLFLAPLFSYTPQVALSAIIMSAMLGLINYQEIIHLYKVDKFDFCICIAAFLGVSFISMDVGLMLSVGLGIIRALLYMARPATCKLGKVPNSSLYRDTEQYPGSTSIQGILVLQLGSPIYFANCTYIRERILRYIREEQGNSDSKSDVVEHLLLDLSGVSSIDMTGLEAFVELRRIMQGKGIKMGIVNPRIEVLEKMTLAHFVDTFGKENFYLSIEDANQTCQFQLDTNKDKDGEPTNEQEGA
ncbi:hypothetical protein CCACVL1_09432 [Corchorus capsularis]|uniref:STAS domain-containing protein n=1 Tax=Corchorus capsularis TaxID=210143 RepID=A0A1R3IW95_COCAP|nr:hypothetical protein CCACVL1_09432 [Corchorus capsularis]